MDEGLTNLLDELGVKLDILTLKLKKMPKGDKEARKMRSEANALDLRMRKIRYYLGANESMELLADNVGASGLLRVAIMQCNKWRFKKCGPREDSTMHLWLTPSAKKLFTTNTYNRLMASMRNKYNDVVMIRFVYRADNGDFVEDDDDS